MIHSQRRHGAHPFGTLDFDQAPFERRAGERDEASDVLTDGAGHSLAGGIGRARGVNDGDGFMFVSHTGEIFPSGFLPVPAGNVRRDHLVEVYRGAPLFRALRDRSGFKGECGVCEYLPVCGGSRARAYAVTGDWLEAEPFCAHVPRRWERMVEAGEAEPVAEYFARRATRQGFALPVFEAAPAPSAHRCSGSCGACAPGSAGALV